LAALVHPTKRGSLVDGILVCLKTFESKIGRNVEGLSGPEKYDRFYKPDFILAVPLDPQ
jgi:hypothetical protein